MEKAYRYQSITHCILNNVIRIKYVYMHLKFCCLVHRRIDILLIQHVMEQIKTDHVTNSVRTSKLTPQKWNFITLGMIVILKPNVTG